MAGQQLTAEQIAAAAGQQGQNAGQSSAGNQQQQQQAPAANQQQQQQAAPGNNQQQGQQQQGQQFIVNQEQFNARWAEKMTALETEIGMPIKDLKPFIEKNKPKAAPTGETLSGADLKLAKMEALMTVGVPSKQIPLLLQHLNISGKTREEIDASIQSLIAVKLLTIEAPANDPGNNQQQQQQNQTPNAAQGAGNSGLPNNQQQPKIWKESEIRELRLSGGLTEAILADIKKAAAEGRVQ